MVTRYVQIESEFDLRTWSQAMKREADEHGLEFVAEYLELSHKTIRGWIEPYESAYGEFPHPRMTNFLKFCNGFGYDPKDFFVITSL